MTYLLGMLKVQTLFYKYEETKINVKQYNETLTLQNPDLNYIITGSSNSIQFAWNFPNEKSVLEFKMSYSTDSTTIPNIEDENALGESYLGDGVTNYNVLFNSSGGSGGSCLAGSAQRIFYSHGANCERNLASILA